MDPEDSPRDSILVRSPALEGTKVMTEAGLLAYGAATTSNKDVRLRMPTVRSANMLVNPLQLARPSHHRADSGLSDMFPIYSGGTARAFHPRPCTSAFYVGGSV